VIARDIIDLFSPMLLQNRVLTDDLGSLLIVRRVPKACIVAEVQRDVPFNGGPPNAPPFSDWRSASASDSG
jgi:hypothetical protein